MYLYMECVDTGRTVCVQYANHDSPHEYDERLLTSVYQMING